MSRLVTFGAGAIISAGTNMKLLSIIYAGLLTLLAVSCNTFREKDPMVIMNDSIGVFLRKNADHPETYEPIRTKIMDTVYYMQNIQSRLASLDKDIEEKLRMQKEYGDQNGDYQRTIQNNTRERTFFLNMQDSLSKSSDPNAIAAYVVAHFCRIKNKQGAPIVITAAFEIKPDFRISHAYDYNMGRPMDYPGGFPRNYKE